MDEQASRREELHKIDAAYRELIRHENDLVSQRLTWLIQSQGLLFTALGFAWKNAPELAIPLALLGIASTISIATAISFYSPTVRKLARDWEATKEELTPELHANRKVMGENAPSQGIGRLLRPWRALPVIFVLGWTFVVVERLHMAGWF